MANRSSVGFGLRPIGKVGQNRDAQGLTEYLVSDSPTIIYFKNGAFYTDPTTQKPTWRNYVPSVAATDIVAFVSDDPYERFEIRSNNTGASATSDIFNNADITYLAGDSANYVSRSRLNDATLSTSSAQLQILGSTKDTGDNKITQSHVVWVVRINEHQLTSTTGV
ncbi:MAG: hypothetical protein EBW12_07820 [Actinobacteria bacterium]|nr:hypothetical protein [Actinomycetota bacterium]